MGRVTMFELQELVRLHRLGTSCHEVARLLGMSPNTERPYREAIAKQGLLQGRPQDLPSEAELRDAVERHWGFGKPAKPSQAPISSVQRWEEEIESMWKNGAHPKAIFDRLKREKKDFCGSLSAVKRACIRLRKTRGVLGKDVVIPVQTAPGEVAQVDFGYVGKLLDPECQMMRKAYVFVMVLGYSRHQYCEIVFDQKVHTWLQLHVRAFEWFGGVPAVLVPDNLKSAVVRCAFSPDEDVALNRSYRELARHFGFKVDPAPPYAPMKKGKVESGVKYVKNNFFKTYGQDLDAQELQIRLTEWVQRTAGQRIHGTTATRPLQLFVARERDALRPLPAVRFEPTMWKSATVHRDAHVQFDKALYSVPWNLVGKQVMVRATKASVFIFCSDLRVATHSRVSPGTRQTHEPHLPKHRADLRHRSRPYWEERAAALGEDVRQYIEEVFDTDDVLYQLRKVQGIVTYLEDFPAHRAQAACRRARFYGNYSKAAIKTILTKGLEQRPLPVVMTQSTPNPAPRFARNVQELLDLHMESTDEPN